MYFNSFHFRIKLTLHFGQTIICKDTRIVSNKQIQTTALSHRKTDYWSTKKEVHLKDTPPRAFTKNYLYVIFVEFLFS